MMHLNLDTSSYRKPKKEGLMYPVKLLDPEILSMEFDPDINEPSVANPVIKKQEVLKLVDLGSTKNKKTKGLF